ncbi:ATP synthase subunit I [Microcoleus sp. FACHB-672]|uniref:ATP synthase subunit I n=1 Tax=Microcoleus sp. FACHB-672 TaxID=2692825 RepID=UPI0016857F75|nr:ATP synthase subunit I [Microcoleus sp. FACHB-672]MBD2041953.1 ATP synthase subunit I [Microcoleus sp. FACHB-672]
MVKNSRSENKIVNRKFERKPAGLSKGFYIGLQVWMLFLVAFLSLGYRIALSVFLGAVGGFAAGFINAWWRTNDPDFPPGDETENQLSKLAKARLETLEKQQTSSLAKQSRWTRQAGSSRRLFDDPPEPIDENDEEDEKVKE